MDRQKARVGKLKDAMQLESRLFGRLCAAGWTIQGWLQVCNQKSTEQARHNAWSASPAYTSGPLSNQIQHSLTTVFNLPLQPECSFFSFYGAHALSTLCSKYECPKTKLELF